MLADKGNGNYGYVDSTREARKVLVDDASGTLVTIAKDVKLQVEFNPSTVGAYRLVGYDNRRLADRDFADDTKDAGEVGAGHAVTAFYEVVPAGGDLPAAAGTEEEPLRYGTKASTAPPTPPPGDPSREMLTVKLRWKEPAGATSTKREFPFTDGGADYAKASADFRFAAAVAAFALVLKESPHRGTATLEAVAELATDGLAFDPGGYRAEFLDLVARARTLLPSR
jgi:Ca-activated chloride channel family protein